MTTISDGHSSGRPPDRHPEFVRSLERGFAVIKAFTDEFPAPLTLTEVAEKTGLAPAAARRFLITLVDLGYVAADERRFSLRPRVLELGYAYLSSVPIWQLAQPHIEALSNKVSESCSASVLDGGELIYTARVPSTRIMTVTLVVGSRLPAYPASMGRVLLAAVPERDLERYFDVVELKPLTALTITDESRLREILSEVREQGWCLVDQELEQGLRSVAVPLHDSRGRVLAAMNIATSTARVSRDTLEHEFLPTLQATADRIENEFAARV